MTQATSSPSRYEAVPMQFSYSSQASAIWGPSGVFEGFDERDLLLRQASAGQLTALELKARTAGKSIHWPQVAGAAFLLLYVMNGNIKFTMSDGRVVILNPKEAVHLPFMLGVKSAEWPQDLHVVQIWAQDPGS